MQRNLVHLIHGARMGPEAIVNGCKGNALFLTVKCCEHHMTRVQGVDEVGR